MKFWNLILILMVSHYGFSNDGVYLSKGSTFYPIHETNISMDKEILSFIVRDKICYVDVYFEFNNPENNERKVSVGFQAPQAAGDVSEEESNTPQIYNFKVSQDGRILPYKLKVAECEDCDLLDSPISSFGQGGGGIFVFLFEITFKPGMNKILHSYNFPASTSVGTDQMYNYILTTGSKWAGGKIKDLTVSIDMGPNSYFYLTDIFGLNADWTFTGIGRKSTEKKEYWEDSIRMVRTINGKLEIKVKDLNPTRNLEFGIICDHTFLFKSNSDWENNDRIRTALTYLSLDFETENAKPFTKQELRLMRNSFYAQEGYVFKSKDLNDYFLQYEWYFPDPNIQLEDIKLSQEVQEFVNMLLQLEKKGNG